MEKGNKKIIRAWTFYDWANSIYPLVISTTIFPIFYETVTHDIGTGENHDMVMFFGVSIKNTVLYSYVIAASFVVVSLLSPILSGIADYAGSKKSFLRFFCYLGALATASLYFFDVNRLELSMVSIFIASIGFWNSLVFYNAYLPEIAEPKDHDKISARGFAMGYFGSSIMLVALLYLMGAVGGGEPLISAKFAFVVAGIWWIGFSHITYAYIPSTKTGHKVTKQIMGNGFKELKKVWEVIKQNTQLKRYLYSFFMFSMGVQTIMLMAVLFAKKEVFQGDDNTAGLIIAVLIIQFVAILGAYVFSFLSNKIGNIKTLMIALIVWVLACLYAYFFVYSPTPFYILAGIVGFVMGGTQSLGRSTYSKFLPETTDTASFFSFYDITEKIGIIIGMVIFGFVESSSGDMRKSILALVVFFVLGIVLLFWVPKSKAKEIQ
ncbi:MFS transporter [Putridiphycobacter roseus]|uniref:MFS transporter n=1 Tax=Putridiphycobacter roseus TaxID=2219161 RepID=A0A2W1NNR0_9FLAO|nr:MFS transporter [Putridiphycobacter roseus]PZE17282.1 MFS transporter [Putridiphycobacter roseus]